MAVQDSTLAGYGVRPLTQQEAALRDERQAAYQRDLAQRQAMRAQQLQQTLQAGLSNQAGRAYVPVEAASTAMQFSRQQLDQANTDMQGIAGRAVANALPPSPTLGLTGAAQPETQVTAQTPAAPATTLSPDILADANQRIADALNQNATPQLRPAERGNYNATNTPMGQAAAPAGINFGFGINGADTARQYLDRMAVVDQQRAADRQRVQGDVERIGLGRMLGGKPSEILAARAQLRTLDAREGSADQRALNAQTAATQSASQAEQARIQGQFGLQEANLRGQYGLDQAQLTGEYGVQSAMERAAGAVQSAQAGINPLEAQRAQLLATRLRQLNAKIEAGTATDEDFLNYTSTAAARTGNTANNPITGAPLSAAEIELEQRRNLERLQQTR